jgi:hypothetical protein
MTESKAPTHTAFALRLEGPSRRRYGRWLEIGTARIEGRDKPAHIFLNRTPIGGWNGYAYLAPIGVNPPEPEPQRPDGGDEDEHR